MILVGTINFRMSHWMHSLSLTEVENDKAITQRIERMNERLEETKKKSENIQLSIKKYRNKLSPPKDRSDSLN